MFKEVSKTKLTSKSKLFDGDKSDFKRLEAQVKTEIQNEVGEEGLKFLFPENPWPESAESTAERRIFELPKRYRVLNVPDLLEDETHIQATNAQGPRFEADGTPVMRPITEADRKTNRDTIDAISAHNKRLTGLTTKCQRVISELCSPHMNLQFNSFYGNPLLCWQFVIDNYGPASMLCL